MTGGAGPPLVIARGGVSAIHDSRQLASLRQQFAAHRHLRLPGLFSPDLRDLLQRRLRRSAFRERIAYSVSPPAVDLKLDDPDLLGFLQFLLNDRVVVDFVREVTGLAAIGGFAGTVYRLVPGLGHRDSWHSDIDGNRLVAITINLSDDDFSGGELEMREREGEKLLWRVANTGRGDGLLFALSPQLQHRIRSMTGTHAKTAFAGWFCIDPDRRG